jgi:tetratricopeptide (TPR) repeat protein
MSHADKMLQAATTHHQAGRLADAEKAYKKLLHADPVHFDGLRLLGGLYLQTGQLPYAVDRLEKAVRLRPQDPETLTNLGIALRGIGRSEDAQARYRQALDVRPNDQGALNQLGSLYHESGRLTEALAIYGQVLQFYPDEPSAHYNYANSLLMSGKVGDAIVQYEHALKLKPDYLEAMVNLGMALSQAGQGDPSRRWLGVAKAWFEKALKAAPYNVVILNNLGNVLRQMGQAVEALAMYREALRLRPEYAEAAINLATSLRDLGQLDAAIESCRAALRYKPDSAEARINLGTFLQDLSRHDEAIEQFTEALRRKPSSLDAQWNKALSLMALGQYAEGFTMHEVGLGVVHMRGDYPSPERRWNGESFVGKRLLIWCEQGLGDSLQFVRYAALCKQRGGSVIVLCPRALRALLSNCGFIDALPESVQEQDFDLHVPMMSLPYIFETTVETIPVDMPYLHVSEAKRAAWAGKLSRARGLKAGLVWAGNPRENQISAHIIDRRRSMSLDLLKPLFDVPNVTFVNLQMGAATAQIDICGLRSRMVDCMSEIENFEDTAALIEQLDMVISVDTSVVHLAGGMGKPVWVLSRFDACWRWLQNRPDSPWYPSARVFGQPSPGDWIGVVEKVGEELEKSGRRWASAQG